MSNRFLALCLTNTFLLAGCQTGRNVGGGLGGDRLAEVERVDAEIIAAMSAGDWDAYHHLMTGQVRWMLPGGETLTGWKEIGPYLDEFGRVLDFTFANRRLSGSGDMAYRTMDFVMVTTTPDPDLQIRYPGKMLTVFRRQPGGQWLVEVEIWNTSPPPVLGGRAGAELGAPFTWQLGQTVRQLGEDAGMAKVRGRRQGAPGLIPPALPPWDPPG